MPQTKWQGRFWHIHARVYTSEKNTKVTKLGFKSLKLLFACVESQIMLKPFAPFSVLHNQHFKQMKWRERENGVSFISYKKCISKAHKHCKLWKNTILLNAMLKPACYFTFVKKAELKWLIAGCVDVMRKNISSKRKKYYNKISL